MTRGRRVVFPVLEQIVARDVGLVADADEGREADAAVGGQRENRQAERAALRRAARRVPAGGTIGENDAFSRTPGRC